MKLQQIQNKIKSFSEATAKVAEWKTSGKKVVFTNGCFDLLHRGHVTYLAKAADEGDVLVLGLNDDASVRRLKGAGRPIQDEDARALVMASLDVIDMVVLFEDDTPLELIKLLMPDILVKGGDYVIDNIVGANEVISNGGKVVTIPIVEGYSTTSIEKKLRT